MSRNLRIDLPYCLYHVMSRANSGDDAFRDACDFEKFLSYLAQYAEHFQFRIHAFCLMKNHFHLLLESREQAMLSELMRRLLTAYTVYYNRRHDRHGHLFQGRFKSLCVDKADYLLQVSRYIHLNPAKEGDKIKHETYLGSSLRFYLGGGAPEWLYQDEILGWFEHDRKSYGRYIRDGLKEEDALPLYQRRFVGGEPFAKRIRGRLQAGAPRDEVRQIKKKEEEISHAEKIVAFVARHFKCSKKLITSGKYLRREEKLAKVATLYLLRREIPWTLREIAQYLGFQNQESVLQGLRYLKQNAEIARKIEQIKT